MTFTVEILEAQSHLTDLLAKVEAGEEIIIARADKPVAKLSPIGKTHDIDALIAEIKAQRAARHHTTQEEIHEWRQGGHRT